MKRFRFAAFCAALLAFTACDVVKQAEGLYNMTQCEYEYDSVTDLSLAGVNLSGELTPLQIARLLGVLGGGASELPMGFDLNLGISNPNSSAAQIGAMDYILERWVLSIPFFISCIRQQNPLTVLSKIILRKVKQFNLPPPKK